ncbi:MAG TPA: hypothetical protein VFA72_06795 [Burkholderiales bacterium]|nr:hypothetical protein [Burkholderiales bacterium]
MKERWMWLVRYVVVIILALILAAALGEMELFKTTRFGKTGLNAARLVQFLSYGGALVVLWLMARRAAALLPSGDERWSVLKSILVPLATLIVVASGQAVLLLVLGPLMNKAWQQAYNWIAIVAIIAAAMWLVVALFTGSASLTELFGAGRRMPRAKQE